MIDPTKQHQFKKWEEIAMTIFIVVALILLMPVVLIKIAWDLVGQLWRWMR